MEVQLTLAGAMSIVGLGMAGVALGMAIVIRRNSNKLYEKTFVVFHELIEILKKEFPNSTYWEDNKIYGSE